MREEPWPFIEISHLPALNYVFARAKSLAIHPIIQEHNTNPHFTAEYWVVMGVV
jgi:hypothetical protein